MPTKRAYALGDFDEATRSVRVLASTPDPVEGEALESFDLTRYAKNPVVLWSHDPKQLPIGRADEILQGPDGLSMRITFASAEANPLAAHVAHLVREKILRGVSVGFEPGEARQEIRDGQIIQVREANDLLEVSFVSIPKDENAGTAAIRGERFDASDDARRDEVDHFDAARLSKVEWTPWGAARIPARFSRIGVLDYPGRREFRPPGEVFKADSVATLKGVPVIDITDHTDFVRPADFRQKVLGFVEEAHLDGEYVAGTLIIHDGPTIEAIKRGDRLDISAGYHAPTDTKPGEWRGERYDCVQRDIIYNHVALCPPGRGRAGPEVGLRLDTNQHGDQAGRNSIMTTANTEKRFIRLDGKDFEIGSQAHIDKLEDLHKAEVSTLNGKIETLSGKLDSAEKAVETAKREKTEADAKTAEAEKERAKDLASRVKSRVRMVMRALRLFGEDDAEEEDEEKKMDALCEMSERDLHLKAIAKVDPDFKADGKTDDYIAGKFEGAIQFLSQSRSVDGVVRVIEEGRKFDAVIGAGGGGGSSRQEHPVAKARRENAERMRKLAEPASAREGGAR
jgi:HK97 family phage prohead protease